MSTPVVPRICHSLVDSSREQIRKVVVDLSKLDAVQEPEHTDIASQPQMRKVVLKKRAFGRQTQSLKESPLYRIQLVQMRFCCVVN